MVEILPNPSSPEQYNDPVYQQHREAWFGAISKSTLFSAISRNSGILIQGLLMALVAAIVGNKIEIGWQGGLLIAGGALVVAGINAVAGYMDETLTKTTNRGLDEAGKIMEARINARENAKALAEALTDSFGKEICNTKQDVSALRKELKTWQERVQEPAPPASQQIH